MDASTPHVTMSDASTLDVTMSDAALPSVAVLQLIKGAQAQHGLRHGDYQRYRYAQSMCSTAHFLSLIIGNYCD
jgi:hypothetical protein